VGGSGSQLKVVDEVKTLPSTVIERPDGFEVTVTGTVGRLPVMVMEKVCGCEARPEVVSVTVTAKVPAEEPGDPAMAPDEASRRRPGGREPEETVQRRVAGLPPTAERVTA